MPARFVFTLALVLSCCFPAGAAFSSSWLETFDGTHIDTDTWRVITPQSISQNEEVFFATADTPGKVTELITKEVAVGVGGAAQVQVSISGLTSTPNYSEFAYLALTTDSSGIGVPWDSYGLIAELVAGPGYAGLAGSTPINVTNIAPVRSFTVSLDETYSLRLERLSDTQVRYTALLSEQGPVLAQITRTLPSYTDPLYVALGARSVDATFDNLQLSGTIIPEPSTLTLLGVGSLTFVRARRRR